MFIKFPALWFICSVLRRAREEKTKYTSTRTDDDNAIGMMCIVFRLGLRHNTQWWCQVHACAVDCRIWDARRARTQTEPLLHDRCGEEYCHHRNQRNLAIENKNRKTKRLKSQQKPEQNKWWSDQCFFFAFTSSMFVLTVWFIFYRSIWCSRPVFTQNFCPDVEYSKLEHILFQWKIIIVGFGGQFIRFVSRNVNDINEINSLVLFPHAFLSHTS